MNGAGRYARIIDCMRLFVTPDEQRTLQKAINYMAAKMKELLWRELHYRLGCKNSDIFSVVITIYLLQLQETLL